MQLTPLSPFPGFSCGYLSLADYQHLKASYSLNFAFLVLWMNQKCVLCPILKVDFLRTVMINSVHYPQLVTSFLVYLCAFN